MPSLICALRTANLTAKRSAQCTNQCEPKILTFWCCAHRSELACDIRQSDKHRKMADFIPSRSQKRKPSTDFGETWHGWLYVQDPTPHDNFCGGSARGCSL